MKSLLVLLTVLSLFSVPAKSDDLSKAEELWAKRNPTAEGILNAQLAANLFAVLADKATVVSEKAVLEIKESDALYYVAAKNEDKAVKIDLHGKGDLNLVASLAAVEAEMNAAPAGDAKEALKVLLAKVLYVKSANMGQWAVARDLDPVALARFPEMTANLQKIATLGPAAASVYDFGVLRIQGRLMYTLPPPQGNLDVAVQKLQQAFKLTGGDAATKKTSRNGSNVLYLAEALTKKGGGNEVVAKQLLQDFVNATATAEEIAALNPDRIPETIEEREEALVKIGASAGE
jgi:hypothetical protein